MFIRFENVAIVKEPTRTIWINAKDISYFFQSTDNKTEIHLNLPDKEGHKVIYVNMTAEDLSKILKIVLKG